MRILDYSQLTFCTQTQVGDLDDADSLDSYKMPLSQVRQLHPSLRCIVDRYVFEYIGTSSIFNPWSPIHPSSSHQLLLTVPHNFSLYKARKSHAYGTLNYELGDPRLPRRPQIRRWQRLQRFRRGDGFQRFGGRGRGGKLTNPSNHHQLKLFTG